MLCTFICYYHLNIELWRHFSKSSFPELLQNGGGRISQKRPTSLNQALGPSSMSLHVALQGTQVIIHLLYQLNGLVGEFGKGWFISPQNPIWQFFGRVNGIFYLTLSFLIPLIQSIYEVVRDREHVMCITLSDPKEIKKDWNKTENEHLKNT